MTKINKNSKLPHQPGPRQLVAQYEAITASRVLPFVHSMVLPEEYPAERLPNDCIAASAVFETREVFNLHSSGKWNAATSQSDTALGYQTTVGIYPGSVDSILSTLGQVAAIDADTQFNPFLDIDRAATGGDYRPTFRVGDIALIPRRNGNSELVPGGTDHMGFEITFAGTTQIDVTVISSKTGSAAIGLSRLRSNGTWFDETAASVAVGGTHTFTAGALGTVLMDLYVDSGACISFSLNAASTIPISCTAYSISSYDGLVGLHDTSKERTTALSGLITYQGSDFANGGQIAGGRLPAGYDLGVAPSGDYYSHFAELPVYADDGALKNGAYGWWCPDSLEEFFFHAYGTGPTNVDNKSCLWFTMNRDDPLQSMRCRAVQHLETQTRSHQYHTEVTESNNMLPEILSLAKRLPAITENEEHKPFFESLWSNFKTAISNPQNWLDAGKLGLQAFETVMAII